MICHAHVLLLTRCYAIVTLYMFTLFMLLFAMPDITLRHAAAAMKAYAAIIDTARC